MAGTFGAWELYRGVPQAIYVCNRADSAVVTLNVVNRNNVKANIRVAVSTSPTAPTLAEMIEFDLELNPKGVLERTGIVVTSGMYLVVIADQALVNAVCWGVDVGETVVVTPVTRNNGTAPAWVTSAGSVGTVTAGDAATTQSLSLVASDPYTNNLTYTVSSGTLPAGMDLLPNGTLANRKTTTGYTAGTTGQTTSFDATVSNGTNSTVRAFSITKKWFDGSTQALAAPSGYWLAQNIGSAYLGSGTYWIKSASMPTALQMYVNMTEEGGGYDFYRIQNGISVSAYNEPNSGTPLGLDLVMPRSKYHWKAMRDYVTNVLGSSDYTYFANVSGIYRTANTVGGNYTTYPMRSEHYNTGGGYAPDWKVKDGGRWWLRDTPYTEPNGDYTLGGFLGNMDRGSFPSGTYAYADLLFNDGGSYATSVNYLVSTNSKP